MGELYKKFYKMVLTFESVDEIPKCGHSIKATEQYVLEVLFTMLYKVVLTHHLKLRKSFFQGFHCRGQAFITNQIMKWFLLLR